MRGIILSIFSILSVLLFSFCLFLSEGLLLFWLFLELGALSLVPAFLLTGESSVLSGLFSYIIVSAISSSLVIGGFIFESVSFLSYVGLLVKFGVFPFCGWVYVVLLSSNWLVVWLISTFLKSGVLFICFFLSSSWSVNLILFSGCATFIFLSFIFWVFTPSWLVYWCHVLISSSASLVVMTVEISSEFMIYLFVVYVVWSSAAVLFLSYFNFFGLGSGFSYFVAVCLLVSFPFSLALFYKLVVGFCIYSCGVAAFLSWVVYNVSEQFFLVKSLVSSSLPASEWSGLNGV